MGMQISGQKCIPGYLGKNGYPGIRTLGTVLEKSNIRQIFESPCIADGRSSPWGRLFFGHPCLAFGGSAPSGGIFGDPTVAVLPPARPGPGYVSGPGSYPPAIIS